MIITLTSEPRSDDQGCLLQTVDDVDLPQRPAAVHWPPDNPAHLIGQLIREARAGEVELADVELEVEIGVEHPVGTVESERHSDDAAPSAPSGFMSTVALKP